MTIINYEMCWKCDFAAAMTSTERQAMIYLIFHVHDYFFYKQFRRRASLYM